MSEPTQIALQSCASRKAFNAGCSNTTGAAQRMHQAEKKTWSSDLDRGLIVANEPCEVDEGFGYDSSVGPIWQISEPALHSISSLEGSILGYQSNAFNMNPLLHKPCQRTLTIAERGWSCKASSGNKAWQGSTRRCGSESMYTYKLTGHCVRAGLLDVWIRMSTCMTDFCHRSGMCLTQREPMMIMV